MHNATSAAAPTVAGAAGLFKHWYLDHHGADFANQPGRLMANLLNMADGFVVDEASAWRPVTDPPTPFWGLGRFRMRYFDSNNMSGEWMRGSCVLRIEPGMLGEGVDLGDSRSGRIPRLANRLVVTLWWLEVNTGKGEDKCPVEAIIYVEYGRDSGFMEHRAANGNHVIRFQYDCADTNGRFGNVPVGDTRLFVFATDVPKDERFPHRDHRSVYVAWYWECGPDLSRIDCGGQAGQSCVDPLVINVGELVPTESMARALIAFGAQ
jgi:hypothetical protein